MTERNDGPGLVILGAGPAGLGAAYYAARRGVGRVTLIERSSFVGGNAGSFEVAGQRVDFGSHRLHPASDPEILEDCQRLLGEDLLDRPRHGRIHLLGRWIHFPLKPLDLAFRLPPSFAVSFAGDLLFRPFRREPQVERESFASVLEAKLGATIARDFYLPYGRKIWGLPAEELSPIQARRRVSADSPLKLFRKVLNAVPGFKPKGSGRFYYPRRGFGQISEAFLEAASEAGAEIRFGAEVRELECESGRVRRVVVEVDGERQVLEANRVWSTIPVSVLTQALRPAAPEPVLQATREIHFRSMLLIYLVVETDQFTEYDAHYFPGEEVPVTRMSEPKNYAALDEPRGSTVLCFELPCSTEDAVWTMDEQQLGDVARDSLARVGLPLTAPVREVQVRRLPQAYPIYLHDYETRLEAIDRHLDSVGDLLSFGRQGLFAHDNTHHALFMARSAADCLQPDGGFDRDKWAEYRKIFATHVVED